MNKYKIAFAQFPGGGSSRMETNAWVVKTVREMDKDERIEKVVSLTYNDTPITMLRNRAVQEAREAGCHYLLMLDSDVAPDTPYPGSRRFWPTAWEFMMGRRKEEEADELVFGQSPRLPPATIAAPYCGPPPEECCYIFEWKNRQSENPNPDFQLGMIPRESAAIRIQIQEVAALPTGLILYDMRVFDVLPPPWFAYEWSDRFQSQKVTTEDVYQTRNASLLGLPQYCAWDCWAEHVKSKRVGKPRIVTRDQVHHSLREAVERQLDERDRLIFLPEEPAGFQESVPSDDPLGWPVLPEATDAKAPAQHD